jgi:hypothetical protein
MAHKDTILSSSLISDRQKRCFQEMFLVLLMTGTACLAQRPHDGVKVNIQYEEPISNVRYPELLYWFVTPETLAPQHYSRDIEHIAQDTVFDFPFLTARNGVNFLDSPAAHDAVAGIVREAHKNGLRIGATLQIQDIDSMRRFSYDDDQTLVGEGETTLDSDGRGTVSSTVTLRSSAPLKTELLRVYAFQKTADGEYDPSTLTNVTAQVSSDVSKPGTIIVKLDLGPRFAGDTVFALATSWFNSLDRFSVAFTDWVHQAIDQYHDVPLDGTSLDEFGYTRVPMNPTTLFNGHFSGRAFSTRFEETTGMKLTDTLFATRYAPAGHPEVRIRAIDEYWDFQRKAPLQIEQEFFSYSRQVFGDKNFAGIHNTFHNHLTNDEVWATGLNWWTIPRQYGMSDEDLSLPLRMGLLVSHPGNIMYDQFYGWDIHRFATKALNDARFDARLHYHGYNDTGRWGADLSTEPFLSSQNPVERKIRLLNHFDPAAPKLPLLIIFGMPALLNWYPDHDARNLFDINGSLHIEDKAIAVWDAGYRCALVPSDLIDNGAVRLDAQNRPVLNGHTFQAIIYLYPQYAKRTTLAFLDQYTRRGGALMLEGKATRDFDGQPADDIFSAIAARARVGGFSVEQIPQLNIERSPLQAVGGELEDGSIILTDLPSLESGQPRPFSVEVSGHRFNGAYVGVFALKATADGRIEKLACGGCTTLSRDSREILRLNNAADLILTRDTAGKYNAIIEGHAGSNSMALRP